MLIISFTLFDADTNFGFMLLVSSPYDVVLITPIYALSLLPKMRLTGVVAGKG